MLRPLHLWKKLAPLPGPVGTLKETPARARQVIHRAAKTAAPGDPPKQRGSGNFGETQLGQSGSNWPTNYKVTVRSCAC